jgi:hypothetical protein
MRPDYGKLPGARELLEIADENRVPIDFLAL